jgi:ABC-type spermidine/putrescine transport system permease subunit II
MRESRLVKSIGSYVARSIGTIFRIFLIYRPFRVFVLLALVLLLPAFALGVRYLVLLSAGKPGDHIQSLILAGILFTGGFVSMALAIISELLAVNRTLLEEIRVRLLKSELAAEYARTDSTSTNTKPVEAASHKVTP